MCSSLQSRESTILARFCSTLSWRRNRTTVASEARPRFSTLSWYVNHVSSGLATVSRRSRIFSHLGRFAVRRDPHLFGLGTQGWEANTFLCLEEGAKAAPGVFEFHVKPKRSKCCKTKTWRNARRQITYVFWHVITYCKTSLLSCIKASACVQISTFCCGFYSSAAFIRGRLMSNILSLQNPQKRSDTRTAKVLLDFANVTRLFQM